MEARPNLTCNVCGENDFRLQEGYYYCNECGTKTDQVRALEVEREDEFDETKHRKTMKIQVNKSGKPELTSWECYNYILRGIVDELIEMGAKEELKLMVLQIWAAYLRNFEIAFFSKKHAELPKLGIRFEKRDATILYNQALERKKKKREKKQNSSIASSSKREFKKKVKKLDQSLYETSMSQSNYSMSQSSIGDSSLNSSGTAPSNRAIQLKFSNKARKYLKKKMPLSHLKKHELDFGQNMTCHQLSAKSRELKYFDMTMDLNMKLLYSIVIIALNLVEDEIQLTDFVRFITDGHISSLSVEKFFPENLSENCDDILSSLRFFVKSTDFSVANLREHSRLLCNFIHIRALKRPDILSLVQRYITNLYLPVEIYIFIERLVNLNPPQMNWNRRTNIPCYESRAMAYIIFTLKLFFGLDGRKEKLISKSAKKVNAQLATMQLSVPEELFVWDEWVEYIEMRKVILSNYSLPICKQFKQTPPRDLQLQYLSQRCKFNEKVLSKSQRKTQQNMELIFRNFLQTKTDEKPPEPCGFSPSFTPHYSYFERIQMDPTVRDQIPQFMNVNHSKRTLQPLLKPSKLEETFKSHGKQLKVVRVPCTSRRQMVGTYRNHLREQPDLKSAVVAFSDDTNAWDIRVKEDNPPETIFKPVMETYTKTMMRLLRKKALNRQGTTLPTDTSNTDKLDNSCTYSVDLFAEDDMDPVDNITLTSPRRNLNKVNIFADMSDNENHISDDLSQDESMYDDSVTAPTGATVLKISNMDCWVVMGKTFELNDTQTNELKSKLPLTFFWFLETCACSLGVPWMEIYDELLVLETFFAYAIEPLDQFEDRIVFKPEYQIKDINKIVRHFKAFW